MNIMQIQQQQHHGEHVHVNAIGRSQRLRNKLSPSVRTHTKPGIPEVDITVIWRAVLLEFVATALFVFYACGSVVAASIYTLPTAGANILAAIVQGFAIATFVYAIGHTSGGHINPAVTFALMITKDIGVLRGVGYIFAQLIGGIAGAGLLAAVIPDKLQGHLGTTTLSNGLSHFQGFLFEFLITFTLIFTIFGTALSKAANASGTHILAPIPIGLAVLVGVGIAYSFTGGSINPARTLGPALVSGTWTSHWVYWLGPMGAAVAVGLLQRFVILRRLDFDAYTTREHLLRANAVHGGTAGNAVAINPTHPVNAEIQSNNPAGSHLDQTPHPLVPPAYMNYAGDSNL